jgi:hypothetical protein
MDTQALTCAMFSAGNACFGRWDGVVGPSLACGWRGAHRDGHCTTACVRPGLILGGSMHVCRYVNLLPIGNVIRLHERCVVQQMGDVSRTAQFETMSACVRRWRQVHRPPSPTPHERCSSTNARFLPRRKGSLGGSRRLVSQALVQHCTRTLQKATE